jgi:hypothetical protein
MSKPTSTNNSDSHRVLSRRYVYETPWLRVREDQMHDWRGELQTYGIVEVNMESLSLRLTKMNTPS